MIIMFFHLRFSRVCRLKCLLLFFEGSSRLEILHISLLNHQIKINTLTTVACLYDKTKIEGVKIDDKISQKKFE